MMFLKVAGRRPVFIRGMVAAGAASGANPLGIDNEGAREKQTNKWGSTIYSRLDAILVAHDIHQLRVGRSFVSSTFLL